MSMKCYQMSKRSQMSTFETDIKAFHLKFQFHQLSVFDKRRLKARAAFIEEERRELEAAIQSGNIEEVADALVDVVYVALGTAYLLKLPFSALWNEVHRSNMAKVRVPRASASKRKTRFDVAKPLGWKKPDIRKVLATALFCLQKPLN